MANERRIAISRVAVRLMVAVSAAALTAGCAESSRYADPFNDPFGGAKSLAARSVDQTPTGSIQQEPSYRQASLAPVDSRPLPPPAANQHSAPVVSTPVAAPSIPGPLPGADPHWTAIGGTPVVMAQGETPAAIANRYGVPTDALVKSNGYATAAEIRPGAKLIIPVYRANANPGAVAKATPAQTQQQFAGGGGLSGKVTEAKPLPAPVMTKAERLAQRQEELKAEREKAAAKESERKAAQSQPQDEARSRKAAEAEARSKKQAELKLRAEAEKAAKAQAKNDPLKYAAARKSGLAAETAQASAPTQVARVDQKVAAATSASAAKGANVDTSSTGAINPDVLKPNSATADSQKSASGEEKRPEFRWPVRGRIIQGFSSGGDGINIAVPEGTQVKAVEEGEVAFAGSELKGFGNMILIRHPNGYVSAYAHNSQIEVKRGDKVKRGQTIARSGQTGNVGSPQLHFELRKGSTPVDPTVYLAGL